MDQAPILLSRRVGFDVMVEINFAANLEERMVGILPILAESKEGTQARLFGSGGGELVCLVSTSS